MNLNVGVVLAAGLGTRLRPSTEYCPKPLIPVAGVEPLFFALSKFHQLGIRRAVVNVHYLPEQVRAALKEWTVLLQGLEVRVSDESRTILGTGGALLKMIQENKDWFDSSGAGMLLQNGDTLAGLDLVKLCANPMQSRFAISTSAEHLKKYKPLWVNAKNEWIGIGPTEPESGGIPAHFLGVHYLSAPNVAEFANAKTHPIRDVDLFKGVYKFLRDQGRAPVAISFFEKQSLEEFWFDMTNQEFLLEAQAALLDLLSTNPEVWGQTLRLRHPAVREVKNGLWLDHAQAIDSGSKIHAPVVWIGSSHGRASLNSIGPRVSVIETSPLGSPALASIENAVLYSRPRGLGGNETLSGHLSGRIAILSP